MTYPDSPRGEFVQRDVTQRVRVQELFACTWRNTSEKPPPMGEVARAPTTVNRGGRDRDVCDPGRRR